MWQNSGFAYDYVRHDGNLGLTLFPETRTTGHLRTRMTWRNDD